MLFTLPLNSFYIFALVAVDGFTTGPIKVELSFVSSDFGKGFS